MTGESSTLSGSGSSAGADRGVGTSLGATMLKVWLLAAPLPLLLPRRTQMSEEEDLG